MTREGSLLRVSFFRDAAHMRRVSVMSGCAAQWLMVAIRAANPSRVTQRDLYEFGRSARCETERMRLAAAGRWIQIPTPAWMTQPSEFAAAPYRRCEQAQLRTREPSFRLIRPADGSNSRPASNNVDLCSLCTVRVCLNYNLGQLSKDCGRHIDHCRLP